MAPPSFKLPKRSCDDANCPFHGILSIRGRVFEATVISDKMDKTVVLRRDYLKYVPKLKRYERRRSHISAHNPPCVNVKNGDRAKIAECRPISKTVAFVAVERLEEK